MSASPLEILVGEWTIEAGFAPGVGGRVEFEWMAGGKFLIERWEVDHPAAPDGLAIIGFDEDRGTWLQHYFDSRGVARVYEMAVGDGVWTLSRGHPGFSQRFSGTFSEDGRTIEGTWEKSEDGETWEVDFDLVYRKVA